jgi:hypothetical protein
MARSRVRPTRILVLILVGPLFLGLLGAMAYLRLKLAKAGMSGWIAESLGYKPIRAFGIQYALRILMPIYFVAGIAAWLSALVPGLLVRREWMRDWKGREALAFGFSALLWMHLVLWWQVPSALWMLPGLRALPFWLLFPLLALVALAFPIGWLSRAWSAGRSRCLGALACWMLLWSTMPMIPGWLPSLRPAVRPGNQECKVLFLGVDGLRSDTFLAESGSFKGVRYQNAYTPIPATRMLWSLIWGGDPMTYTIGHAFPSVEEFANPHDLVLLRDAMAKGWKPRFYIDDGGTIGIAGRRMDLDDSLMPAKGWENFVNSNLAAGFPLYAVWENWFKPFPTTNPWAPMDAGLKESLRLGRGSAWVMFHSCLAHQPIFLTREELRQTGRWWSLSPVSYEPISHIDIVTRKDLLNADARNNPFHSYQIRMGSILKAWEPIWNALDQDPQYRNATRILFSDHGERFHNVANGFQLQGVHGFNLDPWECRVAMLAAGPGFSQKVETTPRDATISIMGFREGVQRLLRDEGPFDATFFDSCVPVAPIRYHTVATSAFGKEPVQYRAEPEKDLAISTYIAPDGIWFTKYEKSTAERSKDASIAYAIGPDLHVFKPIVNGGAQEFHYRKYELVSVKDIDEKTFQEEKRKVEELLAKKAKR